MATFTKTLLSGSTEGKAVKVAATASPGTTIHATGTSAAVLDEVWLYAFNSSVDYVSLTVQFGGTTAVDNDITLTLPPQSGLTLVCPGLVLSGSGVASNTVYAFASVTNVVTLSGYVNRIS